MVEFVNEKFHLPGWRAMSSTYDANNSGWYEAYMELEKILGSLDNTLSAFGGAGFCPISENVDRLFDGFAALSFCRDNLEYELFVEIDEKLMKQFGEMTDEFATLDVRNIRTPNVLGIQEIQVCHDAEGNIASETEVGTVSYLTLENFTGAAGFENTSGYKEQCITGFSKMLEKQYNFYVDEGVLDRNVKLHEYLNGMMPHEFEYSQYTEVWKKTVHSFLDVLVVPTMIEAVTGVEFITGDHLTDNEQAGKAVQSLIQAVSIGMTAGGAYSTGITYVTAGKMQSSQISKYAACKVMKSVAEDGVMNMVTTELTEHDCELAARVLIFASIYVGMQEAPDFVDRYVESGGMVKSNKTYRYRGQNSFDMNGNVVLCISDFYKIENLEAIEDARFFNEPIFYKVEVENKKNVYVSTGNIKQSQFAEIVNESSGRVSIISGMHGGPDGTLLSEFNGISGRQLINEDLRAWGSLPNIKIYDVSQLSAEELNVIINSSDITICGWCFSERARILLEALGCEL